MGFKPRNEYRNWVEDTVVLFFCVVAALAIARGLSAALAIYHRSQ